MARSSYIYVLFRDGLPNDLVGTFTVKHEMETFIERNPGIYYAERYRDGHPEKKFTLVEIEKPRPTLG